MALRCPVYAFMPSFLYVFMVIITYNENQNVPPLNWIARCRFLAPIHSFLPQSIPTLHCPSSYRPLAHTPSLIPVRPLATSHPPGTLRPRPLTHRTRCASCAGSRRTRGRSPVLLRTDGELASPPDPPRRAPPRRIPMPRSAAGQRTSPPAAAAAV